MFKSGKKRGEILHERERQEGQMTCTAITRFCKSCLLELLIGIFINTG